MQRLASLAAALLLALLCAPQAVAQSAPEEFSAMRAARRNDQNMRAEGTLRVKQREQSPMGEPAVFEEWSVRVTWVRQVDERKRVTLLHTRPMDGGSGKGDEQHVSLITEERDGSLSQLVWQESDRRFVRYAGLRPTDPLLNSLFRFEDWLLTQRSGWESGRRESAKDGRIHFEALPYEQYRRVKVRLYEANGLPDRVQFYDRAGQRFRTLRFGNEQAISGSPHPLNIRVVDEGTREESELALTEVVFGEKFPRRALERQSLRRRLRRGLPPLPEGERAEREQPDGRRLAGHHATPGADWPAPEAKP